MEKKHVVWVVCLLLVLCGIFLLRPKAGEMMVTNESGEAVVKSNIEINGTKFDIANFPPGATRKLKFKLEKDNRYTISIEFQYERKLDPQTGYFNDREPNHQLVIKTDGVVLESGE